jgi:hypothetical protein
MPDLNTDQSPQYDGNFRISIKSGLLDINVRRADRSLMELCRFANRYNPNRPILFVSKVLGKHLPVRPKIISQVHKSLAEKLLGLRLPEPIVMIAMAETATGLGHGIFEAFLNAGGSRESLFIHTTRYALNKPAALKLEEAHCHAKNHLVYLPESQEGQLIFKTAKTLVLIDDEISTGNTLLNLAQAFKAQNPSLEKTVLTSITSWLATEAQTALAARFPSKMESVSLLEGSFSYSPIEDGSPNPTFKSEGQFTPIDNYLKNNFGRLGLLPGQGSFYLKDLAGKLSLSKDLGVTIVGTGEFMHAPFLLAKALEDSGFDVLFQSTTRTPAQLGEAIESVIEFKDNYHEGLDNFLYNLANDRERQAVVCYETSPLPSEHDLPQKLKAKTVFF